MNNQISQQILAFLLLSVLLLSACSGNENEQQIPEDLGTPPSLKSDEGMRVVNLESDQVKQLNIQLYSVESKLLEVEVEAPGRVQASPEYYAMVSSPIAGIITELYAHEGEYVNRGQDLLELESLDYANLVADFIETSAEFAYLSEQSDRIKKLREENISSAQEYNRVMADFNRTSARRLTLIARLKALGLTDERLNEWEESPESASARLKMTAPISGKINQHLIDIGEPVKAYAMMLDIINPEEVMVKGFFHPEDAELIEAGDSVFVMEKHLRSDQMHEITSGVVGTINPALDVNNRSVIVNSFVKTGNGRPSPGEQVLVRVSGNTLNPMIEIPSSAIVYDGEEGGVFVKKSDLQYEFRPVDILRMYEGKAAITSGLREGEEVAITQVFSLKALLRFEKFAE